MAHNEKSHENKQSSSKFLDFIDTMWDIKGFYAIVTIVISIILIIVSIVLALLK